MRSRYKIEINNKTYFITSTIQNWISVFTSQKYFFHLIEAIKFNQQNKDLKIYAYVIMPNHFHMICKSEKLSNIMSSIKSYSAKKIIHQLESDKNESLLKQFEKNKLEHKADRRYQIWQEGFHPQEISSDDMFSQKLNYIHFNPVKNGLVKESEEWLYSSARDYTTENRGFIFLNSVDYD